MNPMIIPKAALDDWVRLLRSIYRVVAPKPLHGQHVFGEVGSASEFDLGYPTSVLPPKKYLFPAREDLLKFRTDAQQVEATLDGPRTVVLGVHTCDMHAMQLLDRVMATGYSDQHYLAHRNKTTLVSVECLKPCTAGSFCKSMGTLSTPEAFDLHLTDLGDAYAAEVGSDRGAALLVGLKAARPFGDKDTARLNRVMSDKWPRFPLRLEFDVTELPSLLSTSYDSELWKELGERCLACAMCTNVCPTCYCFNVTDEVDLTLKSGRRVREWDSCQLDKFATVAGGHNFRTTRAARQRHRFFRKGKYQTDAFGLLGCVGCGRCAEACLVHITPVDTFNELYRRQHQPAAATPQGG